MSIRGSIFLVLLLIAGCKSPPAGPPPAADFPTYRQLAESHNARVAALQKLYASGVIQIRWRDRKGGHTEQGNMELWLHLPRRTALRIEKLGEVLAWLGSNEKQSWLFDLTDDERVLHLGLHGLAVNREEQGVISVTPTALLDLIALTPLPMNEPAPAVQYDQARNAWMVEAPGLEAPARIYFDRQSNLPMAVESIAPDGRVNYVSTLRRWESVRVEGVAAAAHPKMPHLIDLDSPSFSAANDGVTAGTVKIDVNRYSTAVDPGQLDRVFDLERLKQALQPGRIEE